MQKQSGGGVVIQLSAEDIQALEAIAKRRGTTTAKLIELWVADRLETEASQHIVEESSFKLSKNQKQILISVLKRTAEIGFGKPFDWVAAKELPEISAPSMSRSLKELEDRELISRTTERQIQLTFLGWHVARKIKTVSRGDRPTT